MNALILGTATLTGFALVAALTQPSAARTEVVNVDTPQGTVRCVVFHGSRNDGLSCNFGGVDR